MHAQDVGDGPYDRRMTSRHRREFHRLRVTLIGSEPEIWRTFDIDASLSLRDLNDALQIIMGWRMSHLHLFTDVDPYEQLAGLPRVGRAPRRWLEPDPFGDGLDGEPEDETTIREAFAIDVPLFYEYDFGDGWVHRIDLIERGPMQPSEPTVALVRGENRAPFEDSGGVGGYAEKLEILADPQRDEHGWIAEWVADTVGPWDSADPGFFDRDAVQRELDLRFPSRNGSFDRAGDASGDMSGLVGDDAYGPLTEASPIVDLAARLPVPVRVMLRAHLHRTGALHDDAVGAADADRGVSAAARADMMAPFRWLVEAVGADGLTLTKAGWMPPAVVLDGMHALGWRDVWIGEANREDITWPMRHLRESAQRMGIVRMQKGRLLLGADAKKTLGDPDRVWRLVASQLLRGLSDAETDAAILRLLTIADGSAGEGAPAAARAIGYGLEMLGWSTHDGQPFTMNVIDELTARTDQVLVDIGALRGRRAHERVKAGARDFAREALR